MRKRFFSFVLALFMLSGVSFAMADAPSPSPAQEMNASAQKLNDGLGGERPYVTINTHGTRVQIYSSSPHVNENTQLFYLQQPFVIVDKKSYNPKTKNLTVLVEFPCRLEEIKRELQSQNIPGIVVEMPMVGYDVVVSYGSEQETIKSYRGYVEISDSVSYSKVITNKAIVNALKNDFNNVNIEANIICEYKRTYGSSARISFSSKFNQKLEERILAFKNEVFMSRESFYNFCRDIFDEVRADLLKEGSIEITGVDVDDLINIIINQNSGLFTETTLGEMETLSGSLWIYGPDNAKVELKPNEISDLKNEYEKLDELKQCIITHWKSLKEIRNQSTDIEDFKKRVSNSTSFSGSGGGGFNFCKILSANGSASGGGSNTYDKSTSHYTFSWKELYDMTAQDSFNKQDFYSKSVEKYKGAVQKLFTQPKDYKVMRIGNSVINSNTKYYLQRTMMTEIVNISRSFPIRIERKESGLRIYTICLFREICR